MSVDKSKEVFDSLYIEWQKNLDQIITEQDARFQIIDEVLTNVLRWDKTEIRTEPKTDSGYIDYLISHNSLARMVLEAKRTSTSLLDTIDKKSRWYALNSSALKSAQDGIEQAKKYANDEGASFAILTNGLAWIGFLTYRPGRKTSDGIAFVFPDLESVSKNFAKFYDFFSKEGVLENRYQILFNKEEGLDSLYTEELEPVITKNRIRLMTKSNLASELDKIFNEFFDRMSAEDDSEMLAKCFVESRESREADSSLQKITTKLIDNIQTLNPLHGKELEKEIEDAVLTSKGETVLIIGNKGAGKTTFIDRFFNLILDRKVRSKCLLLRIDLLQYTGGNEENLTSWLNRKLVEEVEKQLFSGATPSFDQLKGIFREQYDRWKIGPYKPLYETDVTQFEIKFGEYIEGERTNNIYGYLKNLLKEAIRSRLMMPCLVFDNTDQFPQEQQDAIFQYSQGLHQEVFSFVICPITDKSIWRLSKSGPFQTYKTKSFYLPVPSTGKILEKRVNYLKELTENSSRARGNFFLSRGIRLSINDINAFAACIEHVFISTDFISRRISFLTNHDIRRSLILSQQLMTSPLISIDDLFKMYTTNKAVSVKEPSILKAIIVGNYTYYEESHNDFVLNLFSINSDHMTSPLLKLSILQFMKTIEVNSNGDIGKSFISVEKIQKYFVPMGVTHAGTKSALGQLFNKRLIEPFDPSIDELDETLEVRITFCGKMHIEMALNDPTYIGQMALITPLRNPQDVSRIKSIYDMEGSRGYDEWLQIISIFMDYCRLQDSLFIRIPILPDYQLQTELRKSLYTRWLRSIEN